LLCRLPRSLDLLVKDVVVPWRKAEFHHEIELPSPAGDAINRQVG
jgi:hypothetical protein